MDIAPTLLDLIAPANTQFYSMGQSLFNAAPDRRVFGFQTIRHNEQLWRGDLSALYEYYRVNERDKTQLLPTTPPQFVEVDAQAEQAYTQYMATAWQLLTQGMD